MKVKHINENSTSGYPHDKIYTVVDLTARLKNPETGQWEDAVIYTDGQLNFVRSEKNFKREFKMVEK